MNGTDLYATLDSLNNVCGVAVLLITVVGLITLAVWALSTYAFSKKVGVTEIPGERTTMRKAWRTMKEAAEFVDPMDVTHARARQVRAWRVNEGASWSLIATRASSEWGEDYGDNPECGHALCRIAAATLAEDGDVAPWVTETAGAYDNQSPLPMPTPETRS
ncbi:hypothetical protein AB0I53_29760 [Saccharopolyspora sp. NPDC050389]|uniref:hypothetical protein n=1 Tax=Saccharopolyspora sp. NPDC050389 TaxID=3155516 RepID=UPI00340E3A32